VRDETAFVGGRREEMSIVRGWEGTLWLGNSNGGRLNNLFAYSKLNDHIINAIILLSLCYF